MELLRSTFIVFMMLGGLTFWYVDNSHSPAPQQTAMVVDGDLSATAEALQ